MPSNLRTCEDCRCKVASQYFNNSSFCRFCVDRKRHNNEIQEIKKKYDSLKEQYDSLKDLKGKYEALLEFVSANVGTTPPSLASSASQERPSYADVVRPQPASQDDGFQLVRNGAKPPRRPPKLMKRLTYGNRFQVLGEIKEDEFETRLVGDSMIRFQLREFCGRSPNGRRKRYCYKGATVDDMTAVCDTVTDKADENTVIMIHAGTNDVQSTRSEELLEKYQRMIKKYKEKVNEKNIVISGILPRKFGDKSFFNKAFSTNNRLKTLCAEENVNFVNFWDHFYFNKRLFWIDGLHLNKWGSARFGRLLCNELSALRAKNGSTAHPPAPT